MHEVQRAGTDVEGIHYLGREENPLARMMRRIGGQLALGQFQDRFARVIKMERALNLEKDALAFVRDIYRGIQRIAQQFHHHPHRAGMIDGIVHHFRYRVMPDVAHVGRQIGQLRPGQFAPHPILAQPGTFVRVLHVGQHGQLVVHTAPHTGRGDEPFLLQLRQPGAGGLARHTMLRGQAGGNIAPIMGDRIENGTAQVGGHGNKRKAKVA